MLFRSIGGAGAQVDGVIAIKAAPRKPYLNRRQLVFGGSVDEQATGAGRAVVHMPDAPMIFTMLTGNLRRGRPVDAFRSATQLVAYAEVPPPAGTTSGNQPNGVYQNRVEAGRVNLASDGSVKFNAPAGVGVVIELRDGSGNVVVNMGEEHQLAPGEQISMGIREPLFDADGKIRETVTFAELARHVYFTETGEPLPSDAALDTPFVGACRGVGVYLLYNGILGDRREDGGNVLTRAVLAGLPAFDGQKVIYCAGHRLGRDRLQAERIVIRQTPYEIKVA